MNSSISHGRERRVLGFDFAYESHVREKETVACVLSTFALRGGTHLTLHQMCIRGIVTRRQLCLWKIELTS